MVFLNYKLSNILKEKGFNGPCYAHYYYGEFHYNEAYCGRMTVNTLSYVHNNDDAYDGFTDAPTIDQVIKWLRNEKKIHIFSDMHIDYETETEDNKTEEYWFYTIVNMENGKQIYDDYCDTETLTHKSYDDSIIAGINYIINNLI